MRWFCLLCLRGRHTFTSPEVEVTSRVVRRTTLAHGAFSFFYNTAILALVVNQLIDEAA
jgi:uncharacterized membrane protein